MNSPRAPSTWKYTFSASSARSTSVATSGKRSLMWLGCSRLPGTTTTWRATVRAISARSRSNGRLAMFCATSQVSATLIGHSNSSGASIQSRISPNSERCSRGGGVSMAVAKDTVRPADGSGVPALQALRGWPAIRP